MKKWIAGLAVGMLPARTAAAHQAEMAAMRMGHDLEDGAGLGLRVRNIRFEYEHLRTRGSIGNV